MKNTGTEERLIMRSALLAILAMIFAILSLVLLIITHNTPIQEIDNESDPVVMQETGSYNPEIDGNYIK